MYHYYVKKQSSYVIISCTSIYIKIENQFVETGNLVKLTIVLKIYNESETFFRVLNLSFCSIYFY